MSIQLPERDPCPFCENVAGRVPPSGVVCAPVLDEELTFTFMNPRPIQPGTVLVIPKRHAPTILDLTADEATAIMRDVRRLSRALVEALDPVGINLFQNNGVGAYQSVPHFHVVPRYPDDGGTYGDKPRPEVAPLEERLELAERIRRHL